LEIEGLEIFKSPKHEKKDHKNSPNHPSWITILPKNLAIKNWSYIP
jgi:hypothetical protein